jgi:hypothetical protein
MAAIDTFDWFVETAFSSLDEEMKQFIRNERALLLALRSEDERQRFVEEFIKDVMKR